MEIIEPGSWQTTRKLELNESLSHPNVMHLNHDTRPEIILIKPTNGIEIFDGNLKKVQTFTFPFKLRFTRKFADIDNDGIHEIILSCMDGAHNLLVGSDFTPKAIFEGYSVDRQPLSEMGRPPDLVVRQNRQSVVLSPVKNRFYLLKKYRSIFGWGSLIMLLTGLLIVLFLLNQRIRLLKQMHALVIETDSRGILLFDSDKILEINQFSKSGWDSLKIQI